MLNFFKKFADFDPEGRCCKGCGHSAVLHDGKMESKDGFEKFSFNMKRLGCKRCECEQFNNNI